MKKRGGVSGGYCYLRDQGGFSTLSLTPFLGNCERCHQWMSRDGHCYTINCASSERPEAAEFFYQLLNRPRDVSTADTRGGTFISAEEVRHASSCMHSGNANGHARVKKGWMTGRKPNLDAYSKTNPATGSASIQHPLSEKKKTTEIPICTVRTYSTG